MLTTRLTTRLTLPSNGSNRVSIEAITPQVDCGRFPIKRCVGDKVVVEADAFTDGHDQIRCQLRYRKELCLSQLDANQNPHEKLPCQEVFMQPIGNDRWQAEFLTAELGRYSYTVCAWVDPFATWQYELKGRKDPEDIKVALEIGVEIITNTLINYGRELQLGKEAITHLKKLQAMLKSPEDLDYALTIALGEDLTELMARCSARQFDTAFLHSSYGHSSYAQSSSVSFAVLVEPLHARCGAWYEMFPRSCSEQPDRHGTFADCINRLSYVAAMGFDILYLPPIHPIGLSKRKGANNTLLATESDPGSPWAIGSVQGGHTSIHPALGSFKDFQDLLNSAAQHGLSVALDLAFHCSPDHPYVTQHPEWFKHRPDGSVQYAENPPKKYEDIYPFNFESENWRELWMELASVVKFWIDKGITIFRVDNPHTKSFKFWEWLIAEIKSEHPEVIFLSEAFTRPKVLHHLAKLGFSQSYNYFPWRTAKEEITEYLIELSRGESREYLRPNFWPNTPDILTEYLQDDGRPAFMIRLVLAATLGANYGIYGPAFELQENTPLLPGSEEYLHSEKYQLRHWDVNRADSLKEFIAQINHIRRQNPALQQDWNLRFYEVDNDQIICYSKQTDDEDNIILVVVNLDPFQRQAGTIEIPPDCFAINQIMPRSVHELLSGCHHFWSSNKVHIDLDPNSMPVNIFQLGEQVYDEVEPNALP